VTTSECKRFFLFGQSECKRFIYTYIGMKNKGKKIVWDLYLLEEKRNISGKDEIKDKEKDIGFGDSGII